MTHVIRLRGLWDLEVIERFDRGPSDQLPPVTRVAVARVAVPSDWAEWLGDDFLGRVRYTRRFNQPTNLEPHERVWLVVEAVDHAARLTLNGQPLGEMRGDEPGRFDATPLLAPHNTLEIEITLAADVFHDRAARGSRNGAPGGLIGEVRLEIEG